MEVIQSIGWYLPDSTGGSEVYLSGLVDGLAELGTKSRIAAPANGDDERKYVWRDVSVHRYPVAVGRTQAQSAGIASHGHFEKFEQWLSENQADVYHQHSWTYGCGLDHLLAARRLGMPCVLTVHVPGVVCPRGTMMRNGTDICDGGIENEKCGACWLQSRGMAGGIGRVMARIPSAIGQKARPFGRVGSVLSAGWLAQNHLEILRRGIAAADKVVAVCQWLYEALLLNGVPRDKLVLNRQGVTTFLQQIPPKQQSATLRVGFIGRWDPFKGIDTLVQAVCRLPNACRISLQVHAVDSDEPHVVIYKKRVSEHAAADSRIRLLPALPPERVPDFLDQIDVLAVPSRWLETGPLVVLEAFARKVPVIGSNLGGIRELVSHEINGLLVEPEDTAAWVAAFTRLAQDRDLLGKLQSGIAPVRQMRDVANDMQQLYANLC